MNENKKIMLLDGYSYRTLACVRSFGKRSMNFVVGGESIYDISLFSKYCKEKFIYTDPSVNILDFISDINYNIQKFKYWNFLMRTTIDISDKHRISLLSLAAQRGLRGYSRIIKEALDYYLSHHATFVGKKKEILKMAVLLQLYNIGIAKEVLLMNL